MRCPVCGTQNNDLATRCSACGAALPPQHEEDATLARPLVDEADPSEPDDNDEWLWPDEDDSPTGTAERPVALEAPQPQVDRTPHAREVAGEAGQLISSKWKAVGTFFSSHQKALGLGLALVIIGAFGAVWLVANLLDAPAYTRIESDMAELLPAYEYVGGTYGPDLTVPLSGVAVTKRSGTQTPEGMEGKNVAGRNAFAVEAEATFDDGKIRVVRDVAITYVRANGDWQIAGDLSEQGISFTARSGVDEDKVLANMDSILEAASSGASYSLNSIYADGSFSIVGNAFKEAADKDTATDDVTIRCAKQDTFFGYEGNVVAHFAFESGTWTLRSAEANAQAATRTYSPLEGTWTGEMVSTQSNGADCYGARDHALSVVIESVGDPSEGLGQVKGTISGIAHFHERLEKDQYSTSGDTELDELSFQGAIHSAADGDDGVVVECATIGSPNGELELTLAFGTAEDPAAVYAELTTSYTYEEMLLMFIPHQTTAQFSDTYLLYRT